MSKKIKNCKNFNNTNKLYHKFNNGTTLPKLATYLSRAYISNSQIFHRGVISTEQRASADG